MDFRPFFHELIKLSAVSDEEAARALNRYEGLKENRPGLGQIARYSALGAIASPMMTAGEGLIKGEKLKNLISTAPGKGSLRAVAGRAAGGAVGMGLVPIARHMMDQSAERSKLKHYLQEHAQQEKVALVERVARLLATDIPNTPRLLMKHRNPMELAALQRTVGQAYDSHVTDPLMRVAEHGVKRLPERVQGLARKGVKLVAEDPVGTLAANLVPVPGAHPAYVAGKKALERGIDRFLPVPAT